MEIVTVIKSISVHVDISCLKVYSEYLIRKKLIIRQDLNNHHQKEGNRNRNMKGRRIFTS